MVKYRYKIIGAGYELLYFQDQFGVIVPVHRDRWKAMHKA